MFLDGDLDGNGVTNGVDLSRWRSGFGQAFRANPAEATQTGTATWMAPTFCGGNAAPVTHWRTPHAASSSRTGRAELRHLDWRGGFPAAIRKNPLPPHGNGPGRKAVKTVGTRGGDTGGTSATTSHAANSF